MDIEYTLVSLMHARTILKSVVAQKKKKKKAFDNSTFFPS